MTINKFYLQIFFLFLISCIPTHSNYHIENLTDEDIYISSNPSIETFINTEDEKNLIISSKIKQNNNQNLYVINPNKTLLLYKIYGTFKSYRNPYSKLEIILKNDTIILNKKTLNKLLIRKNKNNYYFQIK